LASDQTLAQEKTEEATPHRRREARKKGQVARSTDLNAVLNLLGVVLALFILKGYFLQYLTNFLVESLTQFPRVGDQGLMIILAKGGNVFLTLLAPVLIISFVTAAAANIGQVGTVFSPELLHPKWDRLSLMEGLKKMFGFKTLIELVKNLIKMAVIIVAVYFTVRRKIALVLGMPFMNCAQAAGLLAQMVFSLSGTVIVTYIALAGVDLLYQRHQYRKSLRMTKQEIKEELKQTEGDPHFKAKIRERQRRTAFQRMIKEVPTATVVVTNPTHYAVALRYHREKMDAPQVVAKGADLMAERIKKVAREAGVPLVENKFVAQFLYRQVEVGDTIPDELYQAVAEILAIVYSKHKKKF